MPKLDQQFVEKELSKRSGRNIILKEGYYSAIEQAHYKKIFVDNEYSGVMFDLEDLTEYEKHGILDRQLDRLANKLKEQK